MRYRCLCVWLLLSFFAIAGCNSPDAARKAANDAGNALTRETTKGPVTLNVSISPAKPRLSDTILLTLQVKTLPEVEIIPPFFGEAVGEFAVRSFREVRAAEHDSSSTALKTFVYELEPLQAGKHLIGSLGIDFVDRREKSEAHGVKTALDLDPIELEVSSEFADGAPNLTALAAMQDPIPLPRTLELYRNWLLAGLFLLLVIGTCLYFILRKRQQEMLLPQRSPEEIAFDALKVLMEAQLPEKGEIVEFYVRLTLIVRDYIERLTGIRAPEQTTEEFLRAMRSDIRFNREKALQLERFLESADMVKYAALKPAASDIEDAFSRAQEFVGVKGGQKLVEANAAPASANSATGAVS